MSSVGPGARGMTCDRYLPRPSCVMPRETRTPGVRHVGELERVVRRRVDRLREVLADLVRVDVERGDEVDVAHVVAAEVDVHQPGYRSSSPRVLVEVTPCTSDDAQFPTPMIATLIGLRPLPLLARGLRLASSRRCARTSRSRRFALVLGMLNNSSSVCPMMAATASRKRSLGDLRAGLYLRKIRLAVGVAALLELVQQPALLLAALREHTEQPRFCHGVKFLPSSVKFSLLQGTPAARWPVKSAVFFTAMWVPGAPHPKSAP